MIKEYPHSTQGHSFAGKDLRGKDFRNADIRSTSFRNANLKGSDFTNAQAGLSIQWQLIHLVSAGISITLLGGIAGYFGNWCAIYFNPSYVQEFSAFPGGSILAIVFVSLLIIARRGTTLTAVGGIIGTGFAAGITVMLIATLWIGVSLSKIVAIAVVVAVSGSGAAAIACAMSLILGVIVIGLPRCVEIGSIILMVLTATAVARIGLGALIKAHFTDISQIMAMVVIGFSVYFRLQAFSGRLFSGKPQFANLYTSAIRLAVIGGTSFRGADLSDATFAQASLNSSDFRQAILTRTNWRHARLTFARLDRTILEVDAIRTLLTTGEGSGQNYIQANLAGANLVGANLAYADLTGANLVGATLREANLEHANLKGIQALETHFQAAQLTGACLESWNIDNRTRLEQVTCDYVYLLDGGRERRPIQGQFAPGDFTQLFQIVVNTIELIFRERIDFQQLESSLKIVRAKYPDQPLEVKSINKKAEGLMVVDVRVAEEADKAAIYADLTETYRQLVQTIETRYQSELNAKEELLAVYRQFPRVEKAAAGKVVTLKLGTGSLATGFSVILQIGSEAMMPFAEYYGQLRPAPELVDAYNKWQASYRKSLSTGLRISIPDAQVTNVSRQEFHRECYHTSDLLKHQINTWFNSETFQPLREQLFHHLDRSESIRVILQTDDPTLPKLPLQVWDFFERYPNAEIAYSRLVYERTEAQPPVIDRLKILAVLGDRTGIEIQPDKDLLKQGLPNADIRFLDAPTRQELTEHLWAEQWNVFFFAGHSSTERIGRIQINESESLTIEELRNALRKAIAQGLKLAIFNSCDGLGLATDLAELQIPQVIVMREPVPDLVAQLFLRNFLSRFTTGTPLYQSVREAREQLQGIEDRFPNASWLPIICQNPAESPLKIFKADKKDE
jgi:uncharacterized protein YjbI with pentapeptide repeats